MTKVSAEGKELGTCTSIEKDNEYENLRKKIAHYRAKKRGGIFYDFNHEDLDLMEECIKFRMKWLNRLRYWHHAESGSVWASRKDEMPESDGFVVECTFREYMALCIEYKVEGMEKLIEDVSLEMDDKSEIPDSGDVLTEGFTAELIKICSDFNNSPDGDIEQSRYKDSIRDLMRRYEAMGLDKEYMKNKHFEVILGGK